MKLFTSYKPSYKNTYFYKVSQELDPSIKYNFTEDVEFFDKTQKKLSENDFNFDEVTEIEMFYQNTTPSLDGIEKFKNLKKYKIMGATGDVSALGLLENFEELEIWDPCLTIGLINLPKSIKTLKLGGYLTNYTKEEFDSIISKLNINVLERPRGFYKEKSIKYNPLIITKK